MFKYRKYIGLAQIVSGLFLIFAYFKDLRPDFLEVPVFAIFSFYMEPVFFKWIQTNLLDELGMSLILGGLWLFHWGGNTSVYKAIRHTLILWLLLYLTIFGLAVFVLSMLIFPIFTLIYQLIEHIDRPID